MPYDLSVGDDLTVTDEMTTNGKLILAGKQELSITNIADAITNGTFDSDTWWTHGGNGSISGGYGILGAPTEGVTVSQIYHADTAITEGLQYKLTFTVIDANVLVYLSGAYSYEQTKTPGTYSVTFTAATSAIMVWFERATSSAAKIDDVSLIPLYDTPADVAPTKSVMVITNATDAIEDIEVNLTGDTLPDGTELIVAHKYLSQVDHILTVTGSNGRQVGLSMGEAANFIKINSEWYPVRCDQPAS
jgi:hypothetical protein